MRRKGNENIEKAEVKQRLLETGIRVFAIRGYEGATVREMCSMAGSNIASINYYFGDKRDFYHSVCEYSRLLYHKAIVDTWKYAQTDPWKTLRLQIEAMLDCTYDPKMLLVSRLMMHLFMEKITNADADEESEDMKRYRADYHERITQLMSSLLGDACTTENLMLLKYAFFSMGHFLPIQTIAENANSERDSSSIMIATIQKETLAEFIMQTLQGTVSSMRERHEQSSHVAASRLC